LGPDLLVGYSFQQTNFGARRAVQKVGFLIFQESVEGVDFVFVPLIPEIDVHKFVIA